MFERPSVSPNTLRSQIMSTITTTILRIVLMVLAIGIKELISQRATPTMIITSKIVNSGMSLIFKVQFKFNPLNR
jgi:hypothetical protein